MKLKQNFFISTFIVMLIFFVGWGAISLFSSYSDNDSLEKLSQNHELEIILAGLYFDRKADLSQITVGLKKFIRKNPTFRSQLKKIITIIEKRSENNPLNLKIEADKIFHVIRMETGRELERSFNSNSLRRLINFLFGVFFIVVLFVLSFWFKNTIAGPLEDLERGASEITEGNYTIRLDSKRLGDFSSLAETFNLMSHSIEENIETLLKQKEELKKEINIRIIIEEEHRRLLDIIDETDDLIATIDLNQKITFINQGGRRLINKNAQVMGRVSLSDIYPPWALTKLLDEGFPKAMANKIWKGELALINSFDNEIPILQTLMVHYDHTGNISYLSVIARDISKQKAAGFEIIKYQDQLEELVDKRTLELQRREYEYRQLYDNNAIGLWTIELESRKFVRVNEKAALTFCYSSIEDALDEAVFDNCDFKQRRCEKFWRKIDKYDRVTNFEMPLVENNEEKYLMLEATAFRRKGLLEGSVIDITEKKVAEKELIKAQSELLQTARMAGRAEIVSSILHNVGNVLNSVGIAVDVSHEIIKKMRVSDLNQLSKSLSEANLSQIEKGDKYLEFINALSLCLNGDQQKLLEEFDDLRKHIEHIGKIIRIQQSMGKLAGISERVSINNIIKEAIEVVFSDRNINDIILEKKLDHNLDQLITLDRHKIMQIIINLLSNAKYAVYDVDDQEKIVKISSQQKNDGSIEVEVSDNGVGIAADALRQIFTFGFTTKKDGHGFGLHSCSNVAKELSGDLIASSNGAGQGAKFTLILPFDESDIEEVA